MRTLLAALLLVAPACGSDGGGSPRATPSRTITVEQARKVASAGTLRAADLPGYRVAAAGEVGESPFERGSCLRFEENLADAERDFTTKDERLQIASYAAAMPHEAAAATDLAFLTGPTFAECFERFVTAIFAELDVSVRDYQSRTMSLRVPGSTGAFGYSTRMSGVHAGVRVPVRFVFVGAMAGHAEVMLMVFALDQAPPSDARLQGLLRKAVARARAADV